MALRHTAVTRLAEAECDAGLIASVTGHSEATVLQIIERYRVRTASMARTAFARRLAAECREAQPILVGWRDRVIRPWLPT